jgi:hypothetical protein
MMMSKRLFVAATMVLSVGCVSEVDDDLGEPEFKQTEQEIIVQNLEAAGFPSDDIMVLADGRVVVGRDAVVTMQASRELAGIVSDVEDDDGFRQYRTTNTVNTNAVSTICIVPSADFLANGPTLQALDTAIARYNEQSLVFTFGRDGAGCNAGSADAVISGFVDNSGGGVSGFPSGGLPYHEFYVDGDIASQYGVNVSAHVIMHELGHCIGFRHTDYYDRSISCGGAKTNEGDSDVGAIHIDGTPTTAVLNGSVMNSCYNSGSTGQWTNSDVVALDCLYDTLTCAPPPPPTYDTNLDLQSNQSAGTGTQTQYGPYDATGYDAIRVSLSGNNGDADLYVRFGSQPSKQQYDCQSAGASSNEICEINPSQDGMYYVMVHAWSGYTGLTVSVDAAGAGGGGGGGGGGGASCGNGVCEDGESCDGRNGTSACSSDCDGVTGGKPSGRYCYVGPTCEGPGCP